MFRQVRYTIFLFLLVVSCSAFSLVEVKEFSSDERRDRFQVLVAELRCPKCQNQNLADSNSPIAADLRNEIFRMLEEGKSDQEIVDFLVARYGDFVMYRPPVKKNTLMLWMAPGVLLVVGLLVILLVRRRQTVAPSSSPSLEEGELERLDQLLGNTGSSKKGDHTGTKTSGDSE